MRFEIPLDFIDEIAEFPDVLTQLIEREDQGTYLFGHTTETAEITVVHDFTHPSISRSHK